jgi:uncharacterized membrane protein YeaQ/YmgE (transglycosylase-associated protein family)
LQYADLAIAALGAFFLAWLADTATGRRGLFANLLVSGTGAVVGWFLSVRVFGISTSDQWGWVLGAMGAALASLLIYQVFRSKR